MQPREVLQQIFGHTDYRGCQQAVIERVSGGGHALVIMPTGMGKSLCYQVPALAATPELLADTQAIAAAATTAEGQPELRESLTLVLSPLIALMKDQVDALAAKGVDATFINSSLSRSAREARYRAVGDGQHCLLYVTPERFRKDDFLDVLAKRHVKLLAVDEAHCISEWGHDFRPDYTRLAEIRRLVGDPTTVALTATATPEVQRDIVRQLGLADDEMPLFHEGIDRPNLSLTVEEVWGDEEKLEFILEAVRPEQLGSGSGIVYFTLIKTLEAFSEQLRTADVPHVVYHGSLDRRARRDLQEAFMEGREPLVLATNAFGMGIDKEDIRLVLHADLPARSSRTTRRSAARVATASPAAACCSTIRPISRRKWNSSPGATPTPNTIRAYSARSLTTSTRFARLAWSGCETNSIVATDPTTAWTPCWQCWIATASSNATRRRPISRWQANCPPALVDEDRLAEKLRRDQQKLLALVQYVRHDGDRKAFIHEYFGLPYRAAPV